MALLLLLLSLLSSAIGGAVNAPPARVLDAHVHLTNTSRFQYSGWANASAGTCPCAAPCLCNWAVADWRATATSLAPQRFIFIEVDADDSLWLDEVAWVQSLATGGEAAIGAIVGKAPPGFGTPAVSNAQMAALLDKLAAYPLIRGLRTYVDLTNASNFLTTVAHTRLLAARSLNLEVCLGGLGGNQVASTFLQELVASVPNATFIIDHLGSPPVLGTDADMSVWSNTMKALAQHPHVFVKIGGAFQYYKPCLTCPSVFPTVAQVTPLVELALRLFGFHRAIFEGNWFFVDWFDPADLSVYGKWTAYLTSILDALVPAPTAADLDDLFWGAGHRAYRVAGA